MGKQLKNVKNAFLSKKKYKKTFVNAIKNVTLFLLAFDVGPVG